MIYAIFYVYTSISGKKKLTSVLSECIFEKT